MASNDVIVRLRMLGASAFESQATSAAKSVGQVGESADKAGKQTAGLTRGTGKLRATFARFKGVAAGAAFVGIAAGVKDAVGATTDLAKSTMALERATGLDTRQASAWAEITKVRGIQTKTLQTGFTKLSKVMEAARAGNDKASASLAALGVNQDMIAKGDVSGAVMRTADAFAAMTNPAQKAATAQNLFGKAGIALLPLLQGGSAGIQEQMDLVNKYGATLGNTKGAKEMIARQRELKYATDGLKVTLGQALIPVLSSVAQVFAQVTGALQPFLRNATLVKASVVAITTAFVAYKFAVVASTVASMGMIAVWALIPLAIIAIGAALYVAYRKVKWFRDAVDATIGFIKRNWKLLALGLVAPWALAVVLIVRKFRTLPGKVLALAGEFARAGKRLGKSLVEGMVNAIRQAGGAILGALKSLPGVSALRKLGGAAAKVLPFQHGGVTRPRTLSLVGERGPELAAFPGGTRITPMAPNMALPGLPSRMALDVPVVLQLDGRTVAQVVAKRTADVIARR